MQKKLIFIFFSLLTLAADAQYSEVGIFLGGSRYKGELSPHLFDTKFIHPAAGVFFRRNRTRHWSWRLELNYGKVSGNDAKLNTGYELNRNLNFYSTIIEGTYAFEFNFFPFETGNDRYPFSPYIYSGLTAFYFNPISYFGDVKLEPESTEGQSYSHISFAIPIGGGLKFNTGTVSFAINVSARRTYTDYLDDVSGTYPSAAPTFLSDPGLLRDSALVAGIRAGKERGDPAFKDWYVFVGVNIWVRLTNFQKEFCKPFKRRRY